MNYESGAECRNREKSALPDLFVNKLEQFP